MLGLLPAPLRGVIASLLLGLNTIVCCTPLFIVSLFKLLLPFAAAQRLTDELMRHIHEAWISNNNAWINLLGKARWQVEGLAGLDYQHSYLVTSNHQSWVDILVLQYVLNRRIRPLKFFLKQVLIWVPVIGLAWWALGFPFMKRYSKAYLAKHPEKAGKDLETTRRTCAKFRGKPTAIFNFAEGTRFTAAKHRQQQSPFKHLLKPKAGGIAFVLDAMGEQLQSIVNVTIHYPNGAPGFWDLLCGRVRHIVVHFEELAIPAEFLGRNYDQDETYRLAFQQWINQLWSDKDALLERLRQNADG
ncbi:acyltransferase [Pseudomonas sp. NPDC087612]|uniref:acyltransferase n=1 Tax=unclassified Pseudomonas TaxID=196821 RepID=UPI0005EBB54C|nr:MULTISPECIES: acyltransferase [unclassified Pseudomonas]KJK18311.1 acyltransferase [Pseudomonas sp. 2(2015)]NLU59291.1 acyltransferase [Pseudomonas sp. BIGb0427]QPG65266.1 acyltransferase [Pseudomonas sp. BIGb0427]QVM95987.1 acyltransferase [Pseudomonas sp. SORT22]UVL57146.1 acyltransferase [Pseudomonas sp. B21-035]